MFSNAISTFTDLARRNIQDPPPEVTASWPKPNYINPIRRSNALIMINGILLPLVTAVVAARLYSRLKVVRSAGWDDAVMAFAWFPMLGLTITVCLATTKYGWDVHVWDLPEAAITPARQTSFAACILFVISTASVKASILLFYRRMSASSNRGKFYWAVTGSLIFVVAYAAVCLVALMLICKPVHAYWDINKKPRHCKNEYATQLVAAIINVLTDFVVILLPLPTVWGLQLPVRQKWALCGIFSIGFLVCIAGVIRTVYVMQAVVSYDMTWIGYSIWVWCALEIDIAVICASAPALKPLFVKWVGSTIGSGAGRSTGGIHSGAFKLEEGRIGSRYAMGSKGGMTASSRGRSEEDGWSQEELRRDETGVGS